MIGFETYRGLLNFHQSIELDVKAKINQKLVKKYFQACDNYNIIFKKNMQTCVGLRVLWFSTA